MSRSGKKREKQQSIPNRGKSNHHPHQTKPKHPKTIILKTQKDTPRKLKAAKRNLFQQQFDLKVSFWCPVTTPTECMAFPTLRDKYSLNSMNDEKLLFACVLYQLLVHRCEFPATTFPDLCLTDQFEKTLDHLLSKCPTKPKLQEFATCDWGDRFERETWWQNFLFGCKEVETFVNYLERPTAQTPKTARNYRIWKLLLLIFLMTTVLCVNWFFY